MKTWGDERYQRGVNPQFPDNSSTGHLYLRTPNLKNYSFVDVKFLVHKVRYLRKTRRVVALRTDWKLSEQATWCVGQDAELYNSGDCAEHMDERMHHILLERSTY